MLRLGLMAAVAVVALPTVANAEFLYQGYLKVTSATAACTAGPKVGTIYKSHYHPAAVSGATQNWTGSAISTFQYFGSRSWALNNGSFSSTAKIVNNTVLNSTVLTPKINSKVSITSQSPATLTTTSTSLTFSGKITNPNGLSGQEACSIGYDWAGHVRF